jgi:hypothetical protein
MLGRLWVGSSRPLLQPGVQAATMASTAGQNRGVCGTGEVSLSQ